MASARLEVLEHHAPVQIIEECLDVLGAARGRIDPVGVLVDVERQDRVRSQREVFCASR